MKFASNYGSPTLEKPYREVLRKWRLCLVLVVFFTIVLMNNVTPNGIVGIVNAVSPHFGNLYDYTFNTKVNCTCPVPQGQRQTQCLQSQDNLCGLESGAKRDLQITQLHLTFCSHYTIRSVLGPHGWRSVMGVDIDRCRMALEDVFKLDCMAQQIMCEVETVLARYDCQQSYSVEYNCNNCRKVYREWVCATMLPFFIEDQLVKPCRSFCHRVEQQCPYFHPFYYEQYAGEPVFFCIDPSIPDIPSITPNSPYKQPGSCYESCHVSLDTNASSCNVSDLLETLGANCTGETSNSSTQSIPSDAESNAANPCVVTSLLFIVIHVFWHPLVPRNCIRTNDKLAKRTKLENHVKEPT